MKIGRIKGRDPLGNTVTVPVPGIVQTVSTPLAANAPWDTGYVPFNGAQSIHVSMQADVPGTYQVLFSNDGINPVDYAPGSMPYDPSNVAPFQVVIAPKATYGKLLFVNGNTAQTKFFGEVRYADSIQETLRSVGSPISSSNLASVKKGPIEQPKSDGTGYAQPTVTNGRLDVSASVNFPSNQSVAVSNFPASTEIANDSGNPIPISAASLPLMTGASTSALQTSGNSSLSSIDTKTPTVGQKTMANSSPVVIASDQSPVTVTGTVSTTPNTWTAQSYSYTTGVQTLKGSAGILGAIVHNNSTSNDLYIQFFNTTGAVTLGTTVPTWFYPLDSTAPVPFQIGDGVPFSAGIKFAITTSPAGSTAPGATIPITFFYR
jgi:hypothetical protein